VLRATSVPEELTEIKIAVSDERAHPELVGQGQGGAVVTFRCPEIGSRVAGEDGAEQVHGPRLVTALLVLLRQGHGLLRALASLVAAALAQVSFAEPQLHGSPAHRLMVVMTVPFLSSSTIVPGRRFSARVPRPERPGHSLGRQAGQLGRRRFRDRRCLGVRHRVRRATDGARVGVGKIGHDRLHRYAIGPA
jgi:hypothetical protein